MKQTLEFTPNGLIRDIINRRKEKGAYGLYAKAAGISLSRLMQMVKAEKLGHKIRMHPLTLAAISKSLQPKGGR